MSDTGTGTGKVVVNRSMSLDGFIAGPGDAMDWVFDFLAPDDFPEIAAATGAMLIGRTEGTSVPAPPAWAPAASGDTLQGTGRGGRCAAGVQRRGERFNPSDQPGAGADDDAIGVDGPDRRAG